MTEKLYNLEPTTYKIGDIIKWKENNEIETAPDFQRNLVWSENYKSYLIDTIIRGLPIPMLIIRNKKISLDDYKTKREVVDGQQRLNTIFDFMINKSFKIKKIHNVDFGNMYFNDLPLVIKERINNYKFTIYELPSSTTDSEVLEIFSRLNSTGYKLNKQELRNAEYDGEFKSSIYSISNNFIDMFITWRLFNINDISRMKEAEFTTDIYIFMLEGLRERKPNLFDSYYKKYEENFEKSEELENKYSFVMNSINKVLGEDIQQTKFSKDSFFYHLFILFYEFHYGKDIKNSIIVNKVVPKKWKAKLLKLSQLIDEDKIPPEIIKAFSQGTNNIDSRKKKYKFINDYMYE